MPYVLLRIFHLSPNRKSIALLFFSLLIGVCGFGQKTITELEKDLESSNGITKLNILKTLSEKHLNVNNSQSLAYAQASLLLAKKLNERSAIVASEINVGNAFMALNNHKSSIAHFISALDLCTKYSNKQGSAYCKLKLGLAYKGTKEYSKALKVAQECLADYVILKDDEGQAHQNNLIGEIHFSEKRFTKSITYFFRAFEIDKKRNNKEGMASVLSTIGAAYANYGDFTNSLETLQKGLKIAKEEGLSKLVVSISANIDVVKKNNSSYGSSKSDFEKDQEENEEAYIDNQIKSKTSGFMERIEKLSAENQLKELKLKVQQDEYGKNLLIQQYNTEKKEKEIELLNTEKEKKDAELELLSEQEKIQQLISYFTGSGLLVSLVFAYLIFNRLQLTRKQKGLIENQKQELQENKDQLELQHKRIQDSISYAKRIQHALLTPEESISRYLENSFLLLKPKAGVSGDFFWANEINDSVLFAAVDCTGHGVPGCFMSIVGNNLLNQISSEYPDSNPSRILQEVSLRLLKLLAKNQDTEKKQNKSRSWRVKDGMDIAMCLINKTSLTLHFSGAHNPLYLIRDSKLIEYKGDRLFIGDPKPSDTFTNHEIKLKKGDCLYLFSDGFCDQRGGPQLKKFFYAPFQELLIKIHQKPMKEQKEILDNTFINWMGNFDQVDDVTVFGLKI